ncbi:hypothetical protein SDC9_143745 [bioreactor metagenome]|uniref:Uncharacterized protein n=1 Tax=bioreactor metagenome TaxID=1076179 RepID=A0A645E4S8_9ZZZZ
MGSVLEERALIGVVQLELFGGLVHGRLQFMELQIDEFLIDRLIVPFTDLFREQSQRLQRFRDP